MLCSVQNWIYFNNEQNDNVRDLIYVHVFCRQKFVNQTEAGGGEWHPTKGFDEMCVGGIFNNHPERYAALAWTLFRIVVWTGVAGLLHRKKWYWAL